MKIVQLVHALSVGDAISNEVIMLHRIMQSMKWESHIIAAFSHKNYDQLVTNYKDCTKVDFPDVVILHFSLSSPVNEIFRKFSKSRKVMRFHNVTPSNWFRGYNERVRKDANHGMKELKSVAEYAELVLSNSKYSMEVFGNISDNIKVETLFLPLDVQQWSKLPSASMEKQLNSKGKMNILTVGRIVPNKCIDDVIKIFYFYHCKINPNSHLWIVGSSVDMEIYYFELRQLVHELLLKDAVNFTGAVSDEELRAFYRSSNVYLCMSEHEGFCVPLIEAMYNELPIIAYSSSAIPETLADGGILVDKKEHAIISELIDELEVNKEFRTKVINKGKSRAESFSIDNYRSRIMEIFRSHLNIDITTAANSSIGIE